MISNSGQSGSGIHPGKFLTILLTNDDGIFAPGIKSLYNAFVSKANVVIAAPDREQSGIGHAFTFNHPIHYETTADSQMPDGYVVSGTPVDCVKFAVSHLLKKKPDAIVSGLNIGENSGLSAFYSGTVAAAREGAFWNIPSFAFSLCEEGKQYRDDYSVMAPDIMLRILDLLGKQRTNGVYYNINFPLCAPDRVKGIRVTRQSMAFFNDRYERIMVASHRTGEGFIISGEKIDIEMSDSYDSRAIMNDYIAITPLHFDATANEAVESLRSMENIKVR